MSVNGISFKIMGSGAGPGAPSFFCDCPGCREAIENPALSRTRSGALLASAGCNTLLDTPPDLRVQLNREKIRSIDRIFLTHWHFDHFGGLGELEYYVKLERKKPIPLYLPPSAIESYLNSFPGFGDIFEAIPWSFYQPYVFENFVITPLPANHSIETAGFLIMSSSRRLAYFPDTAGLPAESANMAAGVDWLICDATFYGDNWYPHSHMSVDEAISLGCMINADKTVLTHMSIHYSQPVTAALLQEALSGFPDVLAAFDGMTIDL